MQHPINSIQKPGDQSSQVKEITNLIWLSGICRKFHTRIEVIIGGLMDIRELTQEMYRFVRAKGWLEENSKRPQTLKNLAISLNLEASEVLEHFQWTDTTENLDELEGELADVLLYLLQLASLSNIDLEKAVLKKLKINYQRNWNDDND